MTSKFQRILVWLGAFQLLGLGGVVVLLSGPGDESTNMAPIQRSSDGPPCPSCGQNVAY